MQLTDDYFLSQVREGKAVLFLGSGASLEATNSKGQTPPTAAKLGQLLSAKFLGGKYCDYHTLVKLEMGRLKELLAQPMEEVPESVLDDIVKEIEKYLHDGLQRFPGDSHLLGADAAFANELADSDRAVKSLEKAFSINPRNAFIAIRLARCYENKEKLPESVKTLRSAVDANGAHKALHFFLARALTKDRSLSSEGEIIYHLRRSYGPGDTNYEARLLYGRELYAAKDFPASRAVFQELKSAAIAPEYRDKLQYPLEGRYCGTVRNIEVSYAFILCDGTNNSIYAHKSKMEDELWQRLTYGQRVSFSIAFNCRGASAFDIQQVDEQ